MKICLGFQNFFSPEVFSFFLQCPEKGKTKGMKTDDGQKLPNGKGEGGRKFAPVSPHQLINHFANVFVKSHAGGFQTDLPLMCSSSILPSLFSPHPCLSVPPPSCPIRTDDHQSLQNWKFPQNSGSRRNLNSAGVSRCDLSQKQKMFDDKIEFFTGKKNVERRCQQRCMPRMRLSNLYLYLYLYLYLSQKQMDFFLGKKFFERRCQQPCMSWMRLSNL